jgi:hypothetical protein
MVALGSPPGLAPTVTIVNEKNFKKNKILQIASILIFFSFLKNGPTLIPYQ